MVRGAEITPTCNKIFRHIITRLLRFPLYRVCSCRLGLHHILGPSFKGVWGTNLMKRAQL